MANILCVYENMIATVAATSEVLVSLSKYDSRVDVRIKPVARLTNEDLEYCDVLYMIRPNNAIFRHLANLAHRNGILVVFFLDDDLLHLPADIPDMPWRKKDLALAAKESDVIVSPSPFICNIYSKLSRVSRTVILDTAVSVQDIKQHLDNNSRIKIVYAAGVAHTPLFDRFIRPILKDLDNRCGNKISLTFMGVHPELDSDDYNMPINFIEPMALKDYRKRIENENFDIGLAPLVTDSFTKCKYFNKFIEYAMFGVVGIYSDTEPYRFVVENNKNGILSGDDPKDWLDAIFNAVDNPELVSICRENAYETLRTRFDLNQIMALFIKRIPEVVDDHKHKKVTGIGVYIISFLYRFSRLGDWIYKVGFYFSKGGIQEIINGVKRRRITMKVEKS